jgi:hypothetical protein
VVLTLWVYRIKRMEMKRTGGQGNSKEMGKPRRRKEEERKLVDDAIAKGVQEGKGNQNTMGHDEDAALYKTK